MLFFRRRRKRTPLTPLEIGRTPEVVKARDVVKAPEIPSVDPDVVRAITSSGLFDAEWYLFRYPDVAGFPGGPLAHFVQHGLSEHRDPAPRVSVANYLRRHPSTEGSSIPAFLQALARDDTDERDVDWKSDDDLSFEYLLDRSGLFEPDWYVARYRDVALSGLAPLRHFVAHGASELRDPGPGFDSEFYAERQPFFAEHGRTPIEHFVRYGRQQGLAPAGRPRYARWLERFDELTPGDVERIRSEAGSAKRDVTVFHVVDAEAARRIESILAAWIGQIGVDCRLYVARASALADDAWARCRLLAIGLGAEVVGEAQEIAAPEPGRTVILAGGATSARPHAAFVLAETLARFDADAAYADHDHLDAQNERSRPVFKPAMSPEFLRHLPYAGPLIAARIRDGTQGGGMAAALQAAVSGDPATAWASYLLTVEAERVRAAPFLLFHRHAEQPSDEAPSFEPVPGADRQTSGDAEMQGEWPSVTIIIPTRDRVDLLRPCIESIFERTDYPAERFGLRIVDNGSSEATTVAYLDEVGARPDIDVIPSRGPFNFAAICNAGASGAPSDVLVFLNNDTTVRQGDWLRKLVRFAARPEVAIVGAQLAYPDGTVQHGGTVLGIQGVGAHRLVGVDLDRAQELDTTREMVAVTGACLVVRRVVFEELGGFDETLRVAFNDVALCASAFEAGYRNIYVGEPLLYHHESKSRGFDDSRTKQERNLREAIYVRERFAPLFRTDPSYSPNLSLQRIGDLAKPPRVVRPWRRSTDGRRRALLLSRVHGQGFGVSTVLEVQAAFLRRRGWEVAIGGPGYDGDRMADGIRRVGLWEACAAASFAAAEGMDCVVAHTPPFFSMARYLGRWPLLYFVDHGEPPAQLFPDRRQREDVDWEKRFCAPLAQGVFVISEAVRRNQYRRDAIVARNGNTHLAIWSADWAARRRELRRKFGFEGRFVVLNVGRFGPGERFYKGIAQYGAVASDMRFLYPEAPDRVQFVLAGRGSPEDVLEVEAMGIAAFPNVTDAEMAELYAASDLYMSLAQWEGYNLGIGQALAMGLDVVASNIEAHREFGVETPDSIVEICAAVARRLAGWRESAEAREPILQGWDASLTRFAEVIEADCDAAMDGPWF